MCILPFLVQSAYVSYCGLFHPPHSNVTFSQARAGVSNSFHIVDQIVIMTPAEGQK